MMESVSNEGMCRCCASEGTFKDFLTAYEWMGEEEIYADMLKDCFAITLCTSDDINNGGICEVCITQLRNACNFKRQVQQTEEQFKKRIQDSVLKTNLIKVELPGGDDGEHSDNNLSDDFSATEYEVPIKVEKVEEKPKKRQAAKASTSRAKKSKTEDGEPSAKRRQPDGNAKTKGDTVKRVAKVNKRIVKSEKDEVAIPKTRQGSVELSRHLINVREILTWSNATPIRSHTDIGYLCCYCSDYYQEPADLKQHTLEKHEGINNSSFTKRRDLNAFYVKIDITGLQCRLCDNDIDSIDDLILHLKDVHKKRLFTDIKNHLIAFKFESDVLQCFKCSTKFSRFKGLLEHMNLHCRNFICNVCDAGFVNRKRLFVHQEKHKIGVFQCEVCSEEFPTLPKKKLHIKSIHKPVKFRNKCGYCNETFKDYHQKLKHLTVVHQVEQHAYKCEACDRIYRTRKSFRVHIQRDHLLQRPHHCTECDKNFYSGSALKCHMLKHTGLREFQCDVCLKSYGRKSTLRDHMRIHSDDRRFKCEHCGQAFVQKCSWRGHMRAKHGEEV